MGPVWGGTTAGFAAASVVSAMLAMMLTTSVTAGEVWFHGSENFTAPAFEAQSRLEACRELVATPASAHVIKWKDPLFVIWFPPSSNSSFEHEWLEDTILAKVNSADEPVFSLRHGRPVIYQYPEGCHLSLRYRGSHIPKHVLYVIGAARAPDSLAKCLEAAHRLRQKSAKTAEEEERASARIGLVHMSDEHIGFADLCPADDEIHAPISHIRCDSRLVLLYPLVDYVLRNHWHPKLQVYGDKVKWFPLGHGSGFGRPAANAILPASQRKFKCSFRGAKWENRREFMEAVDVYESLGRLHCQITWTSDFNKGLPVTAFRKELLASAFALSPPGIYNPDCFRIYESMFAGAIPIILHHFQFQPLGNHPIPMLNSWRELPNVIARVEAEGIDLVQQRVYSWWHSFVDRLQTEIALIIA